MDLESLSDRCSRLLGQRQALQEELALAQGEVQSLQRKKTVYSKSSEVLKLLIEKVTERDLKKVAQFVTRGLHQVIHDQKIDCLIEPHPTSGASKIIISGRKGDHVGPFVGTFGGGTWNVSSVVLRVITILKLQLRKRLFLDESLNRLSPGYYANMSAFMRYLVEKTGFKCLLLTTLPYYAEGAHRSYDVFLRKDELVLERAK